MPPANHFLTGADAYALHRPTYPDTFVAALADLAPARRLALDVGCGTGQMSVLLAERFDAVIATDASAAQIAQATPHPKVRYAQAAAETVSAPVGSVDLIVAAQAAHWFDLPAFHAAARTMAAPGAVIALVTYGVMRIHDPVSTGPRWPRTGRRSGVTSRTATATCPSPFPSFRFPPQRSCATGRSRTCSATSKPGRPPAGPSRPAPAG
jgi:SAM-dependent methyltransferase